jgi:hypothetical protein
MSRELVQTAAKLLAKAQSTTSDHEAVALVERSYSLLAQVITAYDEQHPTGPGGARRRERRRVNERRRRARSDAAATETTTAAESGSADRSGAIARYRRAAGDGGHSWRRGIDVRL